jgi:hypothetical protein
MSVESLDVSLLEIIGYANVLPQSALPSIVAPVFRRKENPDSILVPPYSFIGGQFLCKATEITPYEFDSLEGRSELTRLQPPIQAQIQHELWVDLYGRYHYQPRPQTRRNLDRIAQEELEKAETAFLNRQFEVAERRSSIVLLADENNIMAMAIKLAIAKTNRDHSSFETLLELVPLNTRHAMKLSVEDLCERLVDASASKLPRAQSPMFKVATIPSVACAL